MSLNRLEERNFQRRLGYIKKENIYNINSIERDIHKIARELEGQQKLLEKSKNEQRLKQLNISLTNLIKTRRVKSAAVTPIGLNDFESPSEVDAKLGQVKPMIRIQTAKPRALSDSKVLLGKRATTAHPMLRETKILTSTPPPSVTSSSEINNNNSKQNTKEEINKLTDDSNEAFFIKSKRVKSGSVANVLRKTPLSAKSHESDVLRQSSLPSFPSNNELNKMKVLIKFEEIFYNLI